LLHALASELVLQAGDGEQIDLSGHLVVLPTSRGRWRLESLLLDRAATDGRRLVPGEILTPGSLLDRLIVPQRSMASGMASSLAWLESVRGLDASDRLALVGYEDDLSLAETHALAQRLARVCRELAAAHLQPGEVPVRSDAAGVLCDPQRWTVIDGVHADMLGRLDAMQLDDRDASQGKAIDQGRLHLHGIERITLVAAELPGRIRRFLERVSQSGVIVTNVVHGDETALGDVFLDNGTIDVDAWAEQPIDVDNDAIVSVPHVDDQIAAVFEFLGSLGPVDADQARIVVPDEELLPPLAAAAIAEKIPLEHFEGPPITATRTGQLLTLFGLVVERGTASTLGDFIRHPDIVLWLQDQGVATPVATWDAVWSRHVPGHIEDLPGIVDTDDAKALVKPILKLTRRLEGERSASQWAAVLMDVLTEVLQPAAFADAVTMEDHDQSLEVAHRFLTELHELPSDATDLAAVDAILLLRAQLDSSTSQPRERSGGVEVLGWLDAHLDDAPHLVLTGLNEGTLPTSSSVDAWLPDASRHVLGLTCRSRRIARDAFLFDAILKSGRDVRLVSARRANNGEPLAPSSLLLRLLGQPLAERVLHLMGKTKQAAKHHPPTLADRRARVDRASEFEANPMPAGAPHITSMSVTSFRDYLKDPYLFMLKRDSRIKANEVETRHELDAMGFGTLVHDALEQWGREELSRSSPTTDVVTITKDMHAALKTFVAERFGAHAMPGVRLQAAMARHRLTALARVQADRANLGWRIHQVEQSFGPKKYLGFDFESVIFPDKTGLRLNGRIDRVDIHEDHGYQALDYKTGRTAEGPDAAHGNEASGWSDLQLPLYRVLLRSIDIDVPANGLGYILVPPDAFKCRIDIAKWTESDLADAETLAADIINVITSGQLLEKAAEATS